MTGTHFKTGGNDLVVFMKGVATRSQANVPGLAIGDVIKGVMRLRYSGGLIAATQTITNLTATQFSVSAAGTLYYKGTAAGTSFANAYLWIHFVANSR